MPIRKDRLATMNNGGDEICPTALGISAQTQAVGVGLSWHSIASLEDINCTFKASTRLSRVDLHVLSESSDTCEGMTA
ncbi:hypothetical protein D3C87_1952450 [compost metagenome]